jgi:ABC-type glycerol-3-phosphate transport system substrate-binding protein
MRKATLTLVVVLLLAPALGVFAEGQSEGATDEVEEIVVWSWGASEAVVQGLIEGAWPKIEAEMNVKIKNEQFPGLSEPEFVTKVVNAARFGQGPDLIEGNGLILGDLAYQGFCEEVPEFVDAKLQKALLPGYAKVNYLWDKRGNKVPIMGAMVRDAGGQTVFWNRQMYADAGLSRSPLTWSEVFEYGQKLTVRDAQGNITRSGFFYRTAGHTGGIGDKWYPFFLSAGGGSMFDISADGQIKAKMNTDAGRAAVQFYLDGLYKYKIDAIGIPGDVGGWMKGQTATVSTRRAWVPQQVKKEAPEMYDRLGAGPVPHRDGNYKDITTSHAYGLAMNPSIDDKRKATIWKVVDRLNDEDMIAIRTTQTGVWLPYKSPQGKPPFDEQVWTEYLAANANVINRVEGPKFATAYNVIGEELALIFAQEKGVEEGLRAAEDNLNKMFEDVRIKK